MTRQERMHEYLKVLLARTDIGNNAKASDLVELAAQVIDAEDALFSRVAAEFKPMPTKAFLDKLRYAETEDRVRGTKTITLSLFLEELWILDEPSRNPGAIAGEMKSRLWDQLQEIVAEEKK